MRLKSLLLLGGASSAYAHWTTVSGTSYLYDEYTRTAGLSKSTSNAPSTPTPVISEAFSVFNGALQSVNAFRQGERSSLRSDRASRTESREPRSSRTGVGQSTDASTSLVASGPSETQVAQTDSGSIVTSTATTASFSASTSFSTATASHDISSATSTQSTSDQPLATSQAQRASTNACAGSLDSQAWGVISSAALSVIVGTAVWLTWLLVKGLYPAVYACRATFVSDA